MRLDKPINQIDSIVGIPIFSTEKKEDTESITSNEVIEEKEKSKKENTNLKRLKLKIGGD